MQTGDDLLADTSTFASKVIDQNVSDFSLDQTKRTKKKTRDDLLADLYIFFPETRKNMISLSSNFAKDQNNRTNKQMGEDLLAETSKFFLQRHRSK